MLKLLADRRREFAELSPQQNLAAIRLCRWSGRRVVDPTLEGARCARRQGLRLRRPVGRRNGQGAEPCRQRLLDIAALLSQAPLFGLEGSEFRLAPGELVGEASTLGRCAGWGRGRNHRGSLRSGFTEGGRRRSKGLAAFLSSEVGRSLLAPLLGPFEAFEQCALALGEFAHQLVALVRLDRAAFDQVETRARVDGEEAGRIALDEILEHAGLIAGADALPEIGVGLFEVQSSPLRVFSVTLPASIRIWIR